MKVKNKHRHTAVKKTTNKAVSAKTGQAVTPKKTTLAVKPQAKPKKQICASQKRAYEHGRKHGYKAEKERQTVRSTYPKATEKVSFDAGNTVGVACCRIEKAAAAIERVAANIEKKVKINSQEKQNEK